MSYFLKKKHQTPRWSILVVQLCSFCHKWQRKAQPDILLGAIWPKSCKAPALSSTPPLPQITHQARLESGRQPGEQLAHGLSVAGARPAALPVLHHLRGPTEAPLLRPPVLRPLLRPDRQPGLWGHRGSVWVPLSRLQVGQAAGWPGPLGLRLLLRALGDPAAAADDDMCREGARQSLGMKEDVLDLMPQLVFYFFFSFSTRCLCHVALCWHWLQTNWAGEKSQLRHQCGPSANIGGWRCACCL